MKKLFSTSTQSRQDLRDALAGIDISREEDPALHRRIQIESAQFFVAINLCSSLSSWQKKMPGILLHSNNVTLAEKFLKDADLLVPGLLSQWEFGVDGPDKIVPTFTTPLQAFAAIKHQIQESNAANWKFFVIALGRRRTPAELAEILNPKTYDPEDIPRIWKLIQDNTVGLYIAQETKTIVGEQINSDISQPFVVPVEIYRYLKKPTPHTELVAEQILAETAPVEERAIGRQNLLTS